MKNKWIKFEDELPTETPMEQVKILFGHSDWSTYFMGIYTHYPEEPLNERIAKYNPNTDTFEIWDNIEPTHWMKLPNNPKHDNKIK